MKTIVVPTDFSPTSLNAVNYAADLAIATHASIFLLYICPLPMTGTEVPYPPQFLDEMVHDAEKRIEEVKTEIEKKKEGKLKIFTEVKVGMAVTEIKNFCSTVHPHFVVMGAQGSGAIERLIFGRVTLSAIKNLSSPLIIVPQGGKFTAIKKIGLACDLKNVARSFPVNLIKPIIQEFNATVYVIHVNAGIEETYNKELMEQSEDLQILLQDLHPTYHFLPNTGIDEGLTSFAERNELDLLIVVPRKHSLIGDMFHKSHSKQLALHSHVPIMAIHE